MPVAGGVPEELARLAEGPRVLVRRGGPPRPGALSVVYWMQRAVRIPDNPALDVAIEAANALGLPVFVFFSVIPSYPHANLRHYHFLGQALRDVDADASDRGVGFVLRRPPDNSLEAFLEEVQAALVIGDENPCREPERWRAVLARRLKIPFWTVDADVVEWAPNPATAFDWAVILNDKYELDGRDSNGYAGIAWAIVGKHDRPWFDRPVFGSVRSMSGASAIRKFDAEAYLRQNPPLPPP